MNDNTIIPFEYGSLHEDTRLFVQQRTDEIKELMRSTAEDIIHIGQKLLDVKERLDHGDFESWLDKEFAWSLRTARRFMNVATRFKPANLADLSVAPSALYLLSAPSTPDEAVEEALDRAADGEQITHQVAKSIVESHKPEEPSKPLEGSKAWQEYQAGKDDAPPQHWLSRYRDETYLSEKPVLQPVNKSRTLWVAFDNSAIQIADLIDAEWENIEVDNPATHSGKQTVPALKLFAVNNPAWFDALMTHVASEDYEFVYDPELKMVADRMRTAEYGEHTENMSLTPLAAQAQGEPDVEPDSISASPDPLMTSKSVEWYTPSEVVEAARRVLGSIDLDPCSCPEADSVVNAGVYYTIENDGLSHSMDWTAETLFMNPPYGNEVDDWANRLVYEFEDGNVKKAIAILPARTDTEWFRSFAEFPKCFVAGRLKFWGPNDNGNSATFPTVIVALGCNLADFAVEFEEFGDIYIPLDQAHLLVNPVDKEASGKSPETLSEALAVLIKEVVRIDMMIEALQEIWKSPQDQAYVACLKRSSMFGLGTFRDRVEKIAARPETLTAIATLLLDAASERDIQTVLSRIGQAKLGDEQSDAPLETLRGEAEARQQQIRDTEAA